jgi:hypothetical protein
MDRWVSIVGRGRLIYAARLFSADDCCGSNYWLKTELRQRNPCFAKRELRCALRLVCLLRSGVECLDTPGDLFAEFEKKYKGLASEIERAPQDLLDVVFIDCNTHVRNSIVKHTRQDELLQAKIAKFPVQDIWDRFRPGSVVYVQWDVCRTDATSCNTRLPTPPVARYEVDIPPNWTNPIAKSWPSKPPPVRIDPRVWKSPIYLDTQVSAPEVFARTMTWSMSPPSALNLPEAGSADRHKIPPTATLVFLNEVTSRRPSILSLGWSVMGGMPWLHHIGRVVPNLGENQVSRGYCDCVGSVLSGFIPVQDLRDLIILFVAVDSRLGRGSVMVGSVNQLAQASAHPHPGSQQVSSSNKFQNISRGWVTVECPCPGHLRV